MNIEPGRFTQPGRAAEEKPKMRFEKPLLREITPGTPEYERVKAIFAEKNEGKR